MTSKSVSAWPCPTSWAMTTPPSPTRRITRSGTKAKVTPSPTTAALSMTACAQNSPGRSPPHDSSAPPSTWRGLPPGVVETDADPLIFGHVHRHLVPQPAFPQQHIAHIGLGIDEGAQLFPCVLLSPGRRHHPGRARVF